MKETILKIHKCFKQESDSLNKIIGLLDAKGIFKLIDNADLSANPRLASTSKVTDSIRETLETSPELFMFKSKGLLVSARKCEELERSRFRLQFVEPELEGIVDGGHNTLAIASHLISKATEDDDIKAKTWESVKSKWDSTRGDIEAYLELFDDLDEFYVPIEIIYPSINEDDFVDNILEISAARNNNAELTETAKGHHSGFYNELKKVLDEEVESKVEWKTNEPGKTIKSADIVALSLIPMITLQEAGKLPQDIQKINPVAIYASKGQCVKIFNDIVKHESISVKRNSGEDRIEITDPLVKSALKMMDTIPKAYDLIYRKFPDRYNDHSAGFGRISCVKNYDGKTKGGNYTSRQPYTKFYHQKINYKYPDGFIVPLVCGLCQLMEVRGDVLVWKTDDPLQFISDNMKEIVSLLVDMIKSSEYNPQVIGKNVGAYKAISQSIEFSLLKHSINR